MASYTYCDVYRMVTVEIPRDCERFHSHMAFEKVTVKPNQTDYDLWSYNTHIATVEVTNSGNVVAWIESAYNYSISTIHQLSRWLREHDFGFDYYDCKRCDKSGKAVLEVSDNVVIYMV